MATISPRIRRGMNILETYMRDVRKRKRPEHIWCEIDLDELDMGNPRSCVLGQVFSPQKYKWPLKGVDFDRIPSWGSTSGFWIGALHLGIREGDGVREGFNIRTHEQIRSLTRRWEEAILIRRKELGCE
jgi:hypothetical protein